MIVLLASTAALSCTGDSAGDPGDEREPGPPRIASDAVGTPVGGPTPPDSVLIRRGACSSECCAYSRWTTLTMAPVFASERDTLGPIFELQAGDTVTALTGNVHVTSLQRVVVTGEVQEFGDGGHTFLPGDTLAVLDYVGEGTYAVWHEGDVFHPIAFWREQSEWTPDGSAPGFSYGTRASEWWVHVRHRELGEGWVHVSPDVRFEGWDACG